MTRFFLVSLSFGILGVSTAGIFAPHSELEAFLTISGTMLVLRLLAAFFLLYYGLFRSFRQPASRFLLRNLSIGAILMGTIGSYSLYLLPIDLFLLLSCGIFGLVASLELPPAKTTTASVPKRMAVVYRAWLTNLMFPVGQLKSFVGRLRFALVNLELHWLEIKFNYFNKRRRLGRA